jgi:hypothetical protein
VAEAKEVRLVRNLSFASGRGVRLQASPGQLRSLLFRVFESAMSLAGIGTELRVEVGGEVGQVGLRVEWRESGIRREYSLPELGLMVAEAGLARCGAEWKRSRLGRLDTLTVTLPCASDAGS